MYIGNHLSASRGYAAMGRMAVKLGANTFAFFTRNPRGGAAKAIDPADVEKLLELMREQQFGKLVAHAPYTMNLCAAKEDIRKFSKEMIADDLRRMDYTPGNYYNFHPGSHVGQGAESNGLRRHLTRCSRRSRRRRFSLRRWREKAVRWAEALRNCARLLTV